MDIAALKKELDALYARLAPPYGVVPVWHEPAVTGNDSAKAKEKFGATLPDEVKAAYQVFSGIIDVEAPYFMGKEFGAGKKVAEDVFGTKAARFLKDDLLVTGIFPLDKWEAPGASGWGAQQNYRDMLAGGNCKAAYHGCDASILEGKFFIHIGTSDWESIFIDLDAAGENFGAIYNARPSDEEDFLFVYKIADNYFQFLSRLKQSLETRLLPEKAGYAAMAQ